MSDVMTDLEDVARRWWLFVLAGILWIIFAFAVLSASINTVWAIAVLFGIGFIVGGVMELMMAAVTEGWKWLHVVMGVIAILAGILALVWPGQTFLILAAIIGWFLMFDGVFGIVVAVTTRDVNDLWWLGLVVGIAEVLIGFWAVGYVGRSIALLIVWVAAASLARGIHDLVIGFTLHGADKRMRRGFATA
ncbi:MAG TPA: DUF308 domain-containing protein [Ilumatobacteraceae bacterium]